MKISVCIPTFNRAVHLRNCLESIALNRGRGAAAYEICISDNASTDDTEVVVRGAQKVLPIKYHRNSTNVGIPRNFLNVVGMAEGDFAWLVGDDDLLMPTALRDLSSLIERHPDIDYFYVNSFHLTTEYVSAFPQPFDTVNLPNDMKPFSARKASGALPFLDLIDPRISFDFLGGMFLAVFRRQLWVENAGALDVAAIMDQRTFSHFDNTFPHVKIFARAFARSRAYFQASPLSIALSGAREWRPLYPLIRSVRLIEALEEYRRNGLPLLRYWRCRNFAVNSLVPDVAAMWYRRNPATGYPFVNPLAVLLRNCLYPNSYLSPFRYLARKVLAFRGQANGTLFAPNVGRPSHGQQAS